MKKWILAARPRTLVLSFSCLGMGHVLGYSWSAEGFSWLICLLSFATTLQLQILSNFANDLGDTLNGADHHLRQGPVRMVQTGAISVHVMKVMVWVLAISTLFTGIALLFVSLQTQFEWITFLGIGVASILAAIGYTLGKKPYGYAGLGDIAVFIFFGIVAVMGSFYLQVHQLPLTIAFPAATMGLLATAVLNVNNLRDIESDILAGKHSIPVRIGSENGKIYQVFLLSAAVLLGAAYLFQLGGYYYLGFLILLSLPTMRLLIQVFRAQTAGQMDKLLKPTAQLSLLYLFGYYLILVLLN